MSTSQILYTLNRLLESVADKSDTRWGILSENEEEAIRIATKRIAEQEAAK